LAKSEKQIIAAIKVFVRRNSGFLDSWYIGITNDIGRRLSNHGINYEEDICEYWTASSSDVARRIEDYFIKNYDFEGNPGGGKRDSKIVYVFKLSALGKLFRILRI